MYMKCDNYNTHSYVQYKYIHIFFYGVRKYQIIIKLLFFIFFAIRISPKLVFKDWTIAKN